MVTIIIPEWPRLSDEMRKNRKENQTEGSFSVKLFLGRIQGQSSSTLSNLLALFDAVSIDEALTLRLRTDSVADGGGITLNSIHTFPGLSLRSLTS